MQWTTARRRAGLAEADASLEFGRFRVQVLHRQLLADGVPVELGARAFDILMVLIEANGSLVSKSELMTRVWPGIVVLEANLRVQISALRKALGRHGDLIRTECGRGYRFVGVVRQASAPSEASLMRDVMPEREPGAATDVANIALTLGRLQLLLTETSTALATLMLQLGSRRTIGPETD